MNIYKKFLSDKDFKKIQDHMLGYDMPWYCSDGVNHLTEDTGDFQFVYVFIRNSISNCHPDMINLLYPIFSRLKFKQMVKIKANLLTRTNKTIEHGMHTDKEKGKTGIFYVNTCNGYTKFKNGKKIMSEENKYIEFNSKLQHTGASCTDKKTRVVINFNYQ